MLGLVTPLTNIYRLRHRARCTQPAKDRKFLKIAHFYVPIWGTYNPGRTNSDKATEVVSIVRRCSQKSKQKNEGLLRLTKGYIWNLHETYSKSKNTKVPLYLVLYATRTQKHNTRGNFGKRGLQCSWSGLLLSM